MANPRIVALCSRGLPDYVLKSISPGRGKCPTTSNQPCAQVSRPSKRSKTIDNEQSANNSIPLGIRFCVKSAYKPPLPKPNYKGSVILGEDTIAGQVWPMKFRVRRMKPLCNECDKELYLRETITDSQNIMLVSDCCKLDVYPWRKIADEDRVPVAMITGQKKITNKYIYEMLPDPCVKEDPKPPPPPPETPKPSISKRRSTKRKSSKVRKSKKTSTISTKKSKTYRTHESEIHHSAEEVKERNSQKEAEGME